MGKLIDNPENQARIIELVEEHPMESWSGICAMAGFCDITTLWRARKADAAFANALQRARDTGRSQTIECVGVKTLRNLDSVLDAPTPQDASLINAYGQLLGRIYPEFRQRQEVTADIRAGKHLTPENMTKALDILQDEGAL